METENLQITLSRTDYERLCDFLRHKEGERGLAQKTRNFLFAQISEKNSRDNVKLGLVSLCDCIVELIKKDKGTSDLTKAQIKAFIYAFANKYAVGEQLTIKM